MTELHRSIAGLALPPAMARLPLDERGYPVPWFVAWLDESAERVLPRGEGRPDFRIIYPGAVRDAIRGRCWLCGNKIGRYKTFVLGPMCAVNRNSAEPPSHLTCAEYAARACPFLARPQARRRENNLPGERQEPPGIMLARNPGVTLLWTTRRYRPYNAENGVLFDVGEPEHVAWYAHGRPATRAEILTSIESGLPTLREYAEKDGPAAVRALDRYVTRAMVLVPAA